MGFMACMGGLATCPFGVAPTPLTFLPAPPVLGTTGPMGKCTDMAPFLNITPFGVCMSIMNPITATLTAAAFGVLTPGPCIPVPAGIWIPVAPMVMSAGPVLSSDSKLMCAYMGAISIIIPGEFTVLL